MHCLIVILPQKQVVCVTFLPVFDYGDVSCMNASAHCLRLLDSVYHGALRFITNCGPLIHHCVLYSKGNWTSLRARRLSHWYVSPRKHGCYNLRSTDVLQFVVPKLQTELDAWNKL